MHRRLLCLLFVCVLAHAAPFEVDQSYVQKFEDRVSTAGFSMQWHTVTTTDGFQLLIARLSLPTSTAAPNRVVLLQHGLFDSAFTWVANGRTSSLPYILVDAGFDVWVANARGTWFSAGDGFSWSWDEMARYDLPETIEYISRETGQARLSVVAHSQGCAVTLAMGDWSPDVAARMNAFVALAPALSPAHVKSALMNAAVSMHIDDALLMGERFAGDRPFLLTLDFASWALGTPVSPSMDLLGLVFGHSDHLDPQLVHRLMSFFPAPTAIQNLVHWLRMFRSGDFAQYDGTPYQGTALPPDCNITAFFGSKDAVATQEDGSAVLARRLASASSPTTEHLVPGYAHMDFTWAPDAASLVYRSVVSALLSAASSSSSSSSDMSSSGTSDEVMHSMTASSSTTTTTTTTSSTNDVVSSSVEVAPLNDHKAAPSDEGIPTGILLLVGGVVLLATVVVVVFAIARNRQQAAGSGSGSSHNPALAPVVESPTGVYVSL